MKTTRHSTLNEPHDEETGPLGAIQQGPAATAQGQLARQKAGLLGFVSISYKKGDDASSVVLQVNKRGDVRVASKMTKKARGHSTEQEVDNK